MTHRFEPLGPAETRVECQWLFPPEARERPDFDRHARSSGTSRTARTGTRASRCSAGSGPGASVRDHSPGARTRCTRSWRWSPAATSAARQPRRRRSGTGSAAAGRLEPTRPRRGRWSRPGGELRLDPRNGMGPRPIPAQGLTLDARPTGRPDATNVASEVRPRHGDRALGDGRGSGDRGDSGARRIDRFGGPPQTGLEACRPPETRITW